MSSTFAECSLYLSPVDASYNISDLPAFISDLQDTGFISGAVNEQADDAFYTGERFLEHIAYMGCSPAVQFEPCEDGDSFCHIRLHQFKDAILIVSQKQSRAPHCPSCKKPVKSFDLRHQGIDDTPAQITCESCNTSAATADFNWRKMGGYARTFIELTDIFPKEAIPQQSFIDKLSAISGTRWHYFYSCR